MNITFTRNLLLAVAVAVTTVIAAVPPLTLDIHYKTGSAPFTTHVRMTVEPNAGNRSLCLHWAQIQGGQEERVSCHQLDGETAPYTHWQDLKDLASGQWAVEAYIVRSDGSMIHSIRITLHVLGPNYSMDTP